MAIKITSKITEQEALPGATRGRSKHAGPSESMILNSSMVEAGQLLYLGKKHCIPTNRINPFVNIELGTGTILPNEKYKDIIKKAEDLLTGRINLFEEDLTSMDNFNKKLASLSNVMNNDSVLEVDDDLENGIDDYLEMDNDLENEVDD